jgi:hypothetical protein
MRRGETVEVSMVGMAPEPDHARPDDEEQFRRYGEQLAEALRAAIPGWVERAVVTRVRESGRPLDDDLVALAQAAGADAVADVGDRIADLLARDVDEQAISPLSLVRAAVPYPTAVLRHVGVPPVGRDPFIAERFPDDAYDLAPASFADVDPSLADLGIRWGAAKAFVHRRRHLR